jgi:hypothetical protein
LLRQEIQEAGRRYDRNRAECTENEQIQVARHEAIGTPHGGHLQQFIVVGVMTNLYRSRQFHPYGIECQIANNSAAFRYFVNFGRARRDSNSSSNSRDTISVAWSSTQLRQANGLPSGERNALISLAKGRPTSFVAHFGAAVSAANGFGYRCCGLAA